MTLVETITNLVKNGYRVEFSTRGGDKKELFISLRTSNFRFRVFTIRFDELSSMTSGEEAAVSEILQMMRTDLETSAALHHR